MSDNSSDIGAFMAGFVIGGLVGAATALIMAPQSGAETRAQIAEKSEHYREVAGTAVVDARGRVQEGTVHAQERARIVLDEGKTKVSAAIDSSKHHEEPQTAEEPEQEPVEEPVDEGAAD